MRIFIYIIITFLISCSSFIRQKTVDATADVATQGQYQVQTLTQWDQIQAALPSQLAFAETLLPSNPENQKLLAQLIKGYTATGFAISETKMLLHFDNEIKSNHFKKEANLYYSRAINFGQDFLKTRGIEWKDLIKFANNEDGLHHLLKKKLNDDDQLAIFYLGQAWASLINLNRDHIKLVNHLPVARGMIRYICLDHPDFEQGMCQIFEALFQLSRPKMLGGDHLQGEKIFQNLLKKYPSNLLIPVLYAQYVLLPQGRSKDWYHIKDQLKPKLEQFLKTYQYPLYLLTAANEFSLNPQNNLYNVLASIRFEKLISIEKKFPSKI